MLKSEIVIFANSFRCPLDKRCQGCVLQELSELPMGDLYVEIQKMDDVSRGSLVAQCENCQENYRSVNSL